jgi:CheY-like chemotaxis protein
MPFEQGYTEALEAATSPRPTVLVVEDEPNIRELVCLHLGLENYECVQCGDGESALKLARSRISISSSST